MAALQMKIESTEVPEKFKEKDYYTMKLVKSFKSRKFKTTWADYEIKLKPLPNYGNQHNYCLFILNDILESVKSTAAKGSMAQLEVHIKETEFKINESFKKLDDLDMEYMVMRFDHIISWKQATELSEGFIIKLTFTEIPKDFMASSTNEDRPKSTHRYTVFHGDDDDEDDDYDYDLPIGDSDADDLYFK